MSRYKKLFLLFIFLFGGCGADATKKIKIKGSDTVLPVSQWLAEVFLQKRPDYTVSVTGGGSGVGIMSLIANTTDIAMASRSLKLHEKFELKHNNIDYETVIVAYDALAVVVYPGNPVEKLTREQLEKIYTGEITNWKDVGGEDLKIVVYSRESSSGTYEFFKEHVLDGKNYAQSALMLPATGAVVQSVSQTPGAIGYIGLAYLNDKIKPLAVSYDQGKTYVLPSMENASQGKYPVVRPLFYFYDKQKEKKVQPFIAFAKSEEGKKLIKKIGYVPPAN